MDSEQHPLLLIEYQNGWPLREAVHAEQVGPGIYRLLRSPAFVQGIAAGDEFRLTSEDGAFEVTRRSGNLAVQLVSAGPVAPLRGELAERAARLGGRLDRELERALVFRIPVTAGFAAIEAVFDGWVAEHPDWEWSFVNVYDPADGTTPLGWEAQSLNQVA